MIFIRAKIEPIIQVDDKTRIDASGTFVSDGDTVTIDNLEIEPEAGAGFQDVSENQVLDWVYTVDGSNIVTIKITDSDLNETTKSFAIDVVTVASDNLFSNDSDILPLESSLYDYLDAGKDSFISKHRVAQVEILDELNNAGYSKRDGSRYEKGDISDIMEFKELSKYSTLRIIFEGVSNATDDIFHEKALRYASKAINAKQKAYIRLDPDGDGNNEKQTLFTGNLVRTL